MTRTNQLLTVAAIALALAVTACSSKSDSLTGPVAATEQDQNQMANTSTSAQMTVLSEATSESVITLLWGQINGAASYKVICYSQTQGRLPDLETREAGADLEGLSPCTEHYLNVQAIGADGNIVASSGWFSETTEGCAPEAPSQLLVSVNEADMVSIVFLDNADNEDGFRIEYRPFTSSDLSRPWQSKIIAASPGSGFQVAEDLEGLPSGYQVVVRVTAFRNQGESSKSIYALGQTVQEEEDDKLAF